MSELFGLARAAAGKALAAQRKALGVTAERLGRISDISFGVLTRFERGEGELDSKQLDRVREALERVVAEIGVEK